MKMGSISVASDHASGYKQTMILTVDEHAAPLSPVNEVEECDACSYCRDTCTDVESCMTCQKKANAMHARRRVPETNWFMDTLSSIYQDKEESTTYTICQLRRHNHANSAWILVDKQSMMRRLIFEATRAAWKRY